MRRIRHDNRCLRWQLLSPRLHGDGRWSFYLRRSVRVAVVSLIRSGRQLRAKLAPCLRPFRFSLHKTLHLVAPSRWYPFYVCTYIWRVYNINTSLSVPSIEPLNLLPGFYLRLSHCWRRAIVSGTSRSSGSRKGQGNRKAAEAKENTTAR